MAKKNKSPYGKKSPTHSGAKKVIGKIISVVLVAAIVCGLCYAGLNFFGVPQRVAKAVEIDGKSYSMAELSAYYMLEYNNYRYQSSNYDSQYGDGYGAMLTGYDYKVSPAEQSTTNDKGDSVTWDEQFMHLAILEMARVKRYLSAAKEAGTKLTDEDDDTIKKAMTQFDSVLGSYSLSRYLSKSMGKGVTEGLYKKIVTEQTLVSRYQEDLQDGLKSELSEAEIESVYSADKPKYDSVDFRWFTIDVEKADEDSGAEGSDGTAEQAAADAFIEAVKDTANYDEETFKAQALAYVTENDPDEVDTFKIDGATKLTKVSQQTAQSNISADGANWLFEQDDSGNYVRKAGDMASFLNSDGDVIYILFALGTPYRDETVKASVRHILVQFEEPTAAEDESSAEPLSVADDAEALLEAVTAEAASAEDVSAAAASEETTVSQAAKDAARAEAQSILDDYNNYVKDHDGEPAEDHFAEMADQLSDDTATTATSGNGSGGLISDLANDNSYVAEFEDWVFAEGNYAGETRTEGDTAIIETEYGYHVMYFVGGHEKPTWYETIQDSMIQDDWSAWQKDFEGQFHNSNIIRTVWFCEKVKAGCMTIIEKYLSNSST